MIYSQPNISISPGKIALYNTVHIEDGSLFRNPNNKMPISNSHSGVVSQKSSSRIKSKINWLVYKSKNQRVKYPNGTISTNFRISFITLTLPSRQRHSDKEIKQCLDRFLTILRNRYNMCDYVWKAELQGNNNIHFHITTNIYINHLVIRSIWNRCINRLGYVDRYQKKYSVMSYQSYCKAMKKNSKKYGNSLSVSNIQKSFDYGQRTNWSSPNSTDVKTVFKVNSLSAYLSKYLTKSLSGKSKEKYNNSSRSNQERIKEFGGRIWFCSRSLSALTTYTSIFCNSFHSFVVNLLKSQNIKMKHYDYVSVIYFNIEKIPKSLSGKLRKLIDAYISVKSQQLIPAN